MKIILIVLFVCGQPDTFIVKYPNKEAFYTHEMRSQRVMEDILNIMKTDPIIIQYEDDRGLCT